MYEFLNRNMGEIVGMFLTLCLTIIILGCVALSNLHEQAMAEKGYIQVHAIGTSSKLWVKDK